MDLLTGVAISSTLTTYLGIICMAIYSYINYDS